MTTLKYSYRPFSSSLTLWNDDIENELDEDDYDLLDMVYIDAPKDGEWHINISTLKKDGVDYFHGMVALDAFGSGAGWNLYLSKYLPDEVIEQIYANIYKWNQLPLSDDLRERVVTSYFESMEINSDCSFS
jgi:hypothetical protein